MLNDIQPLLHDWLGFFAAQDNWAPLHDEFTARLQRWQETATALQLARWDNEERDVRLSENDLSRLREILKQSHPAANVTGQWQLPAPNPFLQAASEPPRTGLLLGPHRAPPGLLPLAQDAPRGRQARPPTQSNHH